MGSNFNINWSSRVIHPQEVEAGIRHRNTDPSPEDTADMPSSQDQDLASKEPKNRKEIFFVPRRPVYSMSNIILNAGVRQQINILKSRILHHKLLYETWGLQEIDPQGTHIAANFYGPPGTGKTMCAEALASELGCLIIEVNYAEIESKYVGETGKNIRKAFQSAKETGALLFFDEADAILGNRMENVTQAADHAVDVARAVMLKELDNYDGIVIFATNKFEKFDKAFIRRILQHVEVPLPDKGSRLQLWQHMVRKQIPGRETLDWEELAERSEGLSGGDIKNCVVIACSEAVMDPNERIQFAGIQNDDVFEPAETAEKAISQKLCLRALDKALKALYASGKMADPNMEFTSIPKVTEQNVEEV